MIQASLKLLEHELGGRLLERTSTGVRPTNGALAVAEKAKVLSRSAYGRAHVPMNLMICSATARGASSGM
jgi:hypothetical protein